MCASLAQSAERFHGKEKVESSILSGGSGLPCALTGSPGNFLGRRSSVGKSARLIIERSPVRVWPPLPQHFLSGAFGRRLLLVAAIVHRIEVARSKDVVDHNTELVQKARRGDRDAFNELVRSTYRDVYALAYRLTRNAEDANDVVQDAFVRAYRAIRRFRGDSSFSTWMYRITSNCASTHLSRRSRHFTAELDHDTPILDTRPEQDPSLRAEAALLRQHVDRAVRALPERLRQVVVLRDLHDLSHSEIAAELGISTTAAKVRLHRARQRLRDLLHPTHTSEDIK